MLTFFYIYAFKTYHPDDVMDVILNMLLLWAVPLIIIFSWAQSIQPTPMRTVTLRKKGRAISTFTRMKALRYEWPWERIPTKLIYEVRLTVKPPKRPHSKRVAALIGSRNPNPQDISLQLHLKTGGQTKNYQPMLGILNRYRVNPQYLEELREKGTQIAMFLNVPFVETHLPASGHRVKETTF